MKGVILAGGLGTRLNPLTKIANKYMLPMHREPIDEIRHEDDPGTICRIGE